MASASPSPDPSLDAEWQEWKRKYEKTYSQDEEGHRRMVWEENKKKIEEHNAEYEQGMSSFCMGLNEFSDLTNDEFWEMMTCSSDSVLEDQEIINTHLFSDVPEFEDLTEENNMTPEKDQSNSWNLDGNTKIAKDEEITVPLPRSILPQDESCIMVTRIDDGKRRYSRGLRYYNGQPIL